jgi:signal transduction histidine kinase
MIVADNGKGFNEDEIIRGEGLKNLRNRAAQVGAQILIESNDGKGTKIILEVPL